MALWTTPVTVLTGAAGALAAGSGALAAEAGEPAAGAAGALVLATEAAVPFVLVWLAGPL